MQSFRDTNGVDVGHLCHICCLEFCKTVPWQLFCFSCSLQLSASVRVVVTIGAPEGLLFYIGPVSDTTHYH